MESISYIQKDSPILLHIESCSHHENNIYVLQIEDILDNDPEINVFVVHVIDDLDINIVVQIAFYFDINILFRLYNLYTNIFVQIEVERTSFLSFCDEHEVSSSSNIDSIK